MRKRVHAIRIACILGLGILAGCASILPPAPSAPVLFADAADATLIEALAGEQYTRVETCRERLSCVEDHYMQGLIALFQRREWAVASFQEVRSLAPNSRLAASSTSWIDMLQTSGSGLKFLDTQSTGVRKVTEDFVWEALEREFDEANENVRRLFSDRAQRLGRVTDGPPLTSQGQSTILRDKDQATVHALQRRLQAQERTLAERDHRIDLMASQLNALKRIDQDTTRDRRPTLRPLTILAP
jgi:hypothetical protein